jgi:malate dehydrogenase (oxaloacetate-decarboxylating)(NADP+)
MPKITREEALRYHSSGRPGKIEVIPTKPYNTQYDLSLAYTPGVAEPCLEIQKNPDDAYIYTAKCNLVAVITNGTAVLGLGDIGTLAGKPVMEGKGLLFKVFADVDVFDIEVNEKDIEKFVFVVKAIAPTFGGINLEDIKSPECFDIEERLKKELDIPVFHDDQHGTAIISGAGLLNSLEITGKRIEKIKVVVNGAGASAISCARLYKSLGVRTENITMLDSKGVLTTRRTDLNKYKMEFAHDQPLSTLTEAIRGADMFLGLSTGNVLTKEMLQTMAPDPVVFAMANPIPEISYEDAVDARKDVIIATGRSDYPNQVNNVLGFPFIFRGALDVLAKTINEEMKQAAVFALAELAKLEVPDQVKAAYNVNEIRFGREYIIPKPLDPRLITCVAPAVAKAAIETGVARKKITDWKAYEIDLMKRMGLYNKLHEDIHAIAAKNPKTIVFSDTGNLKVLRAVQTVIKEGLAIPVLLGSEVEIRQLTSENNLDLHGAKIVDVHGAAGEERRSRFAKALFEKNKNKGLTYEEALGKANDPKYFGALMVKMGEVDGFLTGFSDRSTSMVQPALQVFGTNNTSGHISGIHIVFTKKGPFFFADTVVHVNPTAEMLAFTALLTAGEIRKLNIEPHIAFLSYSNFGSSQDESPQTVREAVDILHRVHPDIIADGEIQVEEAFDKQRRREEFPFSRLADMDVNTVIFPDLNSADIACKMMHELGGAEIMGPIITGLQKPFQVFKLTDTVYDIVNMAAITVIDAQNLKDDLIRLW